MRKMRLFISSVIIVIIAIGTILFAGCDIGSNSVDINSSYAAIKKEFADNPSNSEIAFIYDAINNNINEYPIKFLIL